MTTVCVTDIVFHKLILSDYFLCCFQDWDYIQGLMARVGKDGLKNKVLHLDTDSVPINQVDIADIIIDPHKLDEAREASTGTAALYQWVGTSNNCNE